MKWFPNAALASTAGISMYAIKITAAELFFGLQDPGEGNATPLLVFDGLFDQAIETVLKDSIVANLADSNLLLNVRVRDMDHHWGAVFRKALRWSASSINYTASSVSIPPLQITLAEYYFGLSDPGAGNATPLLVFDGAYDEALESVFNDSVQVNAGDSSFLLNIRVRDVVLQWGPVFKKALRWWPAIGNVVNSSISIQPIQITQAEYFIGLSDPGEGNGTPLLVFDGAFDEALETVFRDSISVNASDSSFLFNIRVRDQEQHWGALFKKALRWLPASFNTASYFTSIAPIEITTAECFIGSSDPGEGNGIPVLVFDGAYNEALESLFVDSILINVSDSAFLFNIRVRDIDQHWGAVFKRAIHWTGPLVNNSNNMVSIPALHITAGEYFFGLSDPGEGNGLPILAFDGQFDESVEALYRSAFTWPAMASPTLFNIRVKDIDNHWGAVFKKVLYPSGTSLEPQLILEGDSLTICSGQAITLHYIGPNGYAFHWSDSSVLDSLVLLPQVSGYQTITAQGNNEVFSDSVYITVISMPVNFLAQDSVFYCGDSMSLHAPAGSFAYVWNTGSTTADLQVNATGWYYCQVSAAVCSTTDSQFVSIANARIEQSDTTLCAGAAIALNVAAVNGTQSVLWSNGYYGLSQLLTPSQSTVYSVSVNNGYHTCHDSIMILVSSPLVQALSAGGVSICQGDSVTLFGSGMQSYSWTGGISDHVAFLPLASQTYTVTGTDAFGCVASDTISIIVNPLPVVQVSANATIICAGSSVALSANGAVFYQWFPSNSLDSANSPTPIASPTDTTLYTVIGTDLNGCQDSGSIEIKVKPQPLVTPIGNQSYCNGQSVQAFSLAGTPSGVLFDVTGGAARGMPNQYSVTGLPSFTAGPVGTSVVSITPHANGCTGSAYTYTMAVTNCPPVTLNLKFYIEGYYAGTGLMKPVLYNQGETADPNSTNCDYVIVELHHAFPPFSVAKSALAILKTNGTLVCNFPGSVTNTPFYIAINHRNALYSWSANPVLLIPNATYDFSTMAGNVYGGNQIEVSPGVWAIYSGDLNQEENIDLLDASILETDINNFSFGYFASDINGDGNVDLLDSPVLENNINNFIYSVHP